MRLARTLFTLVWCGGLAFGVLTADVAAGPTFCSDSTSCVEVSG